MTSTTTTKFQVLNADGLVVAEYDNEAHAVESARENAAAGFASRLDFYTACTSDGEEIGSWRPVDDDGLEVAFMGEPA